MKLKKKKKIVLSVKISLLVLFILNLFVLGYSHDGREHDEDTYSQFHVLNPMHYFEDSKWFSGVLVIVFWLALIRGVYVLLMMIIAPHLNRSKKKK